MNPTREQFVARATDDAFIKMLSNVLLCVVNENDSNKGVVTRFHSMNAPPISISDYVGRIARHVRCSNECFVLALVYIERITKLQKNFVVSILNVHRLIITAVMLAAKFSDDVYYSNKFYAQVGGVNVAEINMLEAQFLSMLNFQLYVSAIEYESCRMGVEKANLFGCLSSSLWGVPWFNAGRKRASRCDMISEETVVPVTRSSDMHIIIPPMNYAETELTEFSCRTRYFDAVGCSDVTDGSPGGDCKNDSYADPVDDRSPSNVQFFLQNVDPMFVRMPVERMPIYHGTMDGLSHQQTATNPGYHVLSNVHMPQVTTPRNAPVVLILPNVSGMCVNTGAYSVNAMHHPMVYPPATSCSKHHPGAEPLLRTRPRFMLNRMCTQHVDHMGYPYIQWSTLQQPSPVGYSQASIIEDVENSGEEYDILMNALEARYRKAAKENCGARVDPWGYKNNCEKYRSHPITHCSQVPEDE